MQTYTLYIGANNDTKKLETKAIETIVSKRHEGFTLQAATGYWLGTKEKTAVVTIHDTKAKVMATIAELKTELHQDAIGYQQVPQLHFF